MADDRPSSEAPASGTADADAPEPADAAVDEDLACGCRRRATVADRLHEPIGLTLVAGDEHLPGAEHALRAAPRLVGDPDPPSPEGGLRRSAEPDLHACRGVAADRHADGPVGHPLAQHVAVVVGAHEGEVDRDMVERRAYWRRCTHARACRCTGRRPRCTARGGAGRPPR